MGLTRSRVALAVACGLSATGVFYLISTTAVGSPLPAPRPSQTAVRSTPVASHSVTPAARTGGIPRRLVFRHTQPGDVVVSLNGDEMAIEFRQASSSLPASPSTEGGL